MISSKGNYMPKLLFMRPLFNQNPPGERWKDHLGSHGHHRGPNFSKVGALFQQLIGSGIEKASKPRHQTCAGIPLAISHEDRQ
jgi:hypothetical protein